MCRSSSLYSPTFLRFRNECGASHAHSYLTATRTPAPLKVEVSGVATSFITKTSSMNSSVHYGSVSTNGTLH